MFIIEIILIVCTVLAATSIVLTTMKTGISPSPSSGKTLRAIAAAVENSETGPIVDLGSGWGTLVVALAQKYPHRKVTGYELSFVPWLFSSVRKHASRLNNLTLFRRNFLNADLSNASVLTCYLFPEGMVSLKNKLDQDNLSGILIISSTFALPESEPCEVIQVKDIYSTPVYLYRR